MEGGEDEGVGRSRTRLQERGQKKNGAGKIKVELGRWRREENEGGWGVWGGGMGPVVVDTSATGAAEMEGDA